MVTAMSWLAPRRGPSTARADTTPVPVVVGTATTGAAGDFTYTPENLPTGNLVLVQARAVKIAADGTVLYGARVPALSRWMLRRRPAPKSRR